MEKKKKPLSRNWTSCIKDNDPERWREMKWTVPLPQYIILREFPGHDMEGEKPKQSPKDS